jgi:hypothetical protein
MARYLDDGSVMTDEAKRTSKRRTKEAKKDLKKNLSDSPIFDLTDNVGKGRKKILKDLKKDRDLISESGTAAPRARSYGTPSRSGKPLNKLRAVSTEKVKTPQGTTETITEDKPLKTKKKPRVSQAIPQAKGGTVRLKSGGPVVDSYDYS